LFMRKISNIYLINGMKLNYSLAVDTFYSESSLLSLASLAPSVDSSGRSPR